MRTKFKRIISVLVFLAFVINSSMMNYTDVNAAQQTNSPSVSYTAHVQNIGWQPFVKDGGFAGTEGKSYRVEGIIVKIDTGSYTGGITYRSYVQGIGWQGYMNNGSMTGTNGQSKRLEAIQIKLTGDIANYYDVYYTVHAQNYGWLGWAKNGETSGTVGYGYRLEGIMIKLVKKGNTPPSNGDAKLSYEQEDRPFINYMTYVQNEGWKESVRNGGFSGSLGKAQRIESIIMNVDSTAVTGGIRYRAMIQGNKDWTEYMADGASCGTNGQSKRLEAIQIELTGQLADQYDVYYRTYVENKGWVDWTKNGETSGSIGKNARIEAIQIQPVVKNGTSPGGDTGSSESQDDNKTKYKITYHLDGGDNYLKGIEIHNGNQEYYTSEDGLKLKNISVDGYVFDGWYDEEGKNASLVREIAKGETGNKDVYAHWTVKEYTIQFDSPLVKVDSIKYKTNEGATLSNPEWFGYTFLGWSNDEGEIVKRIQPGTTGNMTLHANWTSKRNQTIPVDKLGEPIIYEDPEQGIYLFTYKIGKIENVPLYTIKYFGNSSGISITETTSETGSITESSANTIVKTIANATTRTTSWALSKEWNDIVTIDESHSSESGSESTTSTNVIKSQNGGYSLSSGRGVSASATKETGVSGKISASGKIGASGSVGVAKVSGEVEVGEEFETYRKRSGTLGATWNTEAGITRSKESSKSQTNSSTLSSKISETYGIQSSHSEGGSSSSSEEIAVAQTNTDEYASALTYSKENTITTVKQYSNENAPEGYYRLVAAATVHVFAVVGYDISTKTYFVYSYNIIDDDVKDFIDYSKTTSNFDDYENGILPFDVPVEVDDYLNKALAMSEGLVVNSKSGKIVDYEGTDLDVVVPDYISIDNGDNTHSVVKVTGFEKGAFANNSEIKSISLGKYITEIPDSAFENCTSLESVNCPGVVSIGNNSFKNCNSLKKLENISNLNTIGNSAFEECTALQEFKVSNKVVCMGNNAFKDVQKIVVDAVNKEVGEAAIKSGAKNIIITDAAATGNNVFDHVLISVPDSVEYFELKGNGKTYTGLEMVSNANTTVLNNVNIVNNTAVPVKVSSGELVLNRASINASKIAMILSADTTELSLLGEIDISTTGENAVLCKNVNLTKINASVYTKLNITGNAMVCGVFNDNKLSNISNGSIILINNDSYDRLSNDSLEWVLATEVPQGATIIDEKWTYDLTTRITSSNKLVTGYTLYNTTWVWGSYGAWSGWTNNYIAGSDSRQVETQTIPATYKTQWHYDRWNASNGWSGPWQGYWSGNYCGTYQETGWNDSPFPIHSTQVSGGVTFHLYSSSNGVWYNETTRQVEVTSAYTQYRYRDRSKVYTYYHQKVEQKESDTEVVASDSISNVKKWVKYVAN